MSHNNTFCNKLLQCFNKNPDFSVQPDLTPSSEHVTKNDIYKILELIHLSNDSHIQIKLISILTIYMMSNGTDKNIIIKFNPLYDKICEIFTKGHQKKSNIALNFLASVLHTDDEGTRGRALVLHAQNMIRASGCLMAMANIFTNGLLHQDTWQALCRCLTDTCSGLESNQNYCAHLIPACVRYCRPGNEHVFQVVQSLLANNERNTQLFYKCGGARMFKREFLKFDRCLQLLNTVLSNRDVGAKVLKDTTVLDDLEDLKQKFGSTSQIGQWISIIFYTINLKGQDFKIEIEDNKRLSSKEDTRARQLDNALHVPINSLNSDQLDDTSELLKNILTEVVNFKQRQNINRDVTNNPQTLHTNKTEANKFIETIKDSIGIEKLRNTNKNIPSISLLMSNSVKNPLNVNYTKDKDNIFDESNYHFNRKTISENTKAINKVSHCCNKENTEIIDFKPKCASTPKRTTADRSSKFKPTPIHKSYKRKYNSAIDSKLKIDSKTNKNESARNIFKVSGLLDVINETCTTIMRSVTNVFRSKKTGHSDSEEDSSIHDTKCNSFTNYMRRRDALLQDSTSRHLDSTSRHLASGTEVCTQYECETCNDTLALRRKITNDDVLKETINKIKLGINLYGCDFKKISRTFWRDESYMTPTVLCNLYRKLILK